MVVNLLRKIEWLGKNGRLARGFSATLGRLGIEPMTGEMEKERAFKSIMER